MENGPNSRMHFDFWSEFAVTFRQNCRVKLRDNLYSSSQGHCKQESIERMSKPIKGIFL